MLTKEDVEDILLEISEGGKLRISIEEVKGMKASFKVWITNIPSEMFRHYRRVIGNIQRPYVDITSDELLLKILNKAKPIIRKQLDRFTEHYKFKYRLIIRDRALFAYLYRVE